MNHANPISRGPFSGPSRHHSHLRHLPLKHRANLPTFQRMIETKEVHGLRSVSSTPSPPSSETISHLLERSLSTRGPSLPASNSFSLLSATRSPRIPAPPPTRPGRRSPFSPLLGNARRTAFPISHAPQIKIKFYSLRARKGMKFCVERMCSFQA